MPDLWLLCHFSRCQAISGDTSALRGSCQMNAVERCGCHCVILASLGFFFHWPRVECLSAQSALIPVKLVLRRPSKDASGSWDSKWVLRNKRVLAWCDSSEVTASMALTMSIEHNRTQNLSNGLFSQNRPFSPHANFQIMSGPPGMNPSVVNR